MDKGGAALEHKSRKLIYNYISTNPGSTFETIKKFFDMNKSTLTYHLKYLIRHGKVTSKLEDGQRCYYCAYKIKHRIHSFITEKQAHLTEVQEQLVTIIQNQPGVTNKELMLKTKLNRKNLSYNIKKLRDKKLIWSVKTDGILGYEYITKEKLRHEMVTRLISRLLAEEIDESTYHKIKNKLDTVDLDELMK